MNMMSATECLLQMCDEHFELEDYQSGVPRWCTGCGDNAILAAVQRLCRDEGLRPEKTVFVSGIGCSSRFPHYMKTYGFHGIHGRALPVAEGVKMARKALVAGLGWFLLTAMVLRTCHHWAGVAWDASALFDSRLTQAALSIAWSIMGVLAMLLGNRRVSRPVWFGGAALLAVVVVKLFVVELADRGGLYRIVSFIGVGVLLLVVGYFAPVPVKASPVLEGQDEAMAKDET